MYSLKDITTVHVELTSKCNASCPMCLRNILGGKVNPQLPICELTKEDFKKIFPEDMIKRLQKMYFCGNYGDPIMAKEALDIIEDLRRLNPTMRLEIHTNGAARNTKWWADLAKTSTKVIFGIDGLEDTNSIYRRGTKWPVLMANVKSFIDAGGVAEWTYIVFKHNEHQVETARELADKIGFKKFTVKKTGRFFSNIRATGKDAQEVFNGEGEFDYYIEKPTKEEYINKALNEEALLQKQFGDLKNYFGQTEVECRVLNEKSLYITAEGYAFPCCWTANQLYPWYYPPKKSQIWTMINNLPLGLESLNAKKIPLEQILKDRFFSKDIPENWDKKSLKDGRLFVCGKTCGKKFNTFNAQFR